jgi:peptide/nickel transport system ATP-binding protein
MSEADMILSVENLSVAVGKGNGRLAVEEVSFDIGRGEVFGMVGESGCGKSLCALSIAGLLRAPLHVAGGEVRFEGQDILRLPARDMRRLRGGRISMIFQEPMTALNPLMTVGDQIGEMFVLHQGLGRAEARHRAIVALAQVQVPSPERRISDYPHQLSGGMRQRVMIAIALACRPALLIADEPTTALDVTIQAEITELILDLCRAQGTAVLMISHDLGHIAEICNRVAVMYAGRVAEMQSGQAVFQGPRHPYTRALVASLPQPGRRLAEGRQDLAEFKGIVPPLGQRPPGCQFAPRCARAADDCRAAVPPFSTIPGGGKVGCFHHD